MIHQTELRDLLTGMVPFPTDVFTADQAWLGQHLLPLLKIDLGVLRPELAGQVATMLCPIEPYDGCIGETTEEHHNAFTGTNWIAFELTACNEMRFLGNEGYFIGDAVQDKDAQEHIAQMRESYAKARDYHATHGRLACYSRYGKGEPSERDYLDTLGDRFPAATGSRRLTSRTPSLWNSPTPPTTGMRRMMRSWQSSAAMATRSSQWPKWPATTGALLAPMRS